jgi:putative heme-binding domain-containing protein
MTLRYPALALALFAFLSTHAPAQRGDYLRLKPDARVVLMGSGLGSRMQHFGFFERVLHVRYPDHRLVVRNMCDEGNTPSFRPHSGRANQLGFPGAGAFHAPYSDGNSANGVGHFWSEEEWLEHLQPDVLVCFFGFTESFEGLEGLANFRAELDAFLKHTKAQAYGTDVPPQLALVSPTAFEDRSGTMGVPNGRRENSNLAAYTSVMDSVATHNGVHFVNCFNASLQWYEESRRPLTSDGALLNEEGYARLAEHLIDNLFSAPLEVVMQAASNADLIHAAVQEKNWFWTNDFKVPNGVHVFGRRYNPFGPANYPFEIEKIREMTRIRDRAIWMAARGEILDVAALDAATAELPAVETNYKPGGKNGPLQFLEGGKALASIEVPEGYRIEQWATEVEFPDLANPVQMSFDNQGRLWVATMPSYPHYRPGDPRPDDKLLILEDTDGDGKADKQTVWADGLHLPMGFEFAPEGVYLSQGVNLVLLSDTNGDDYADKREIIFSGFDDHDTHHAIGAYCADPSGAIMMCEGTFLRTNVETPYGTVRGTNGGFYRFAPQRRHLERHAQLSIPNPWGIAFDDWGQHFFLHTSGPTTEWMLPGSVRPRYGVATPGSKNLIEANHRVRPTAGIEFLSSRHFPDEVQGDMLLNNTIGFLGTKQHKVSEEGAGFATTWRQDLTRSTDGNYRPVDLEIAPDGSLYLIDWHNPLIGHMQHNIRDPHRDHDHGRIYRITYPSRPLVEPALVHLAPIETLLENLKLHEYRSRYRSRRELRGRDSAEVLATLASWVDGLDPADAQYEHNLLEALWVTWGCDRVDEGLLRRLLGAEDHRARAAAVRVLRYNGHRVADQARLLARAAGDRHARVQLEALTAASWLGREEGLEVLAALEASYPPKQDEPSAQHVTIQNGGRRIRINHPTLAAGRVSSFRMTVPGKDRIINLAEMEIISGGTNVAAQASLSQSSEYNGGSFPIANLVDGERSNFSHTSSQADPWIEVRMDPPFVIDAITIWNRPGFESRFDGALVELFEEETSLATLKVSIAADTGVLGDPWLRAPFRTAEAHLRGQTLKQEVVVEVPEHLAAADHEQYLRGAEIYSRDGHCSTCHQPDGLGLPAAGFPPLGRSPWVTEDEDRLIMLTLNGLLGPMEVLGKPYPGLVPMTPFGDMLSNEELAAVLTYVRNSFGNEASPTRAEKIEEVRVTTQGKIGFYSPDELQGGAATVSRPFVRFWELSNFEEALQTPLKGRNFARGQEMFEVATCATCHNMQGRGGKVGADLSQAGNQYRGADLLRQILDPSAIIKEEHRLHYFELDDGSVYQGQIVEYAADSVIIAESLLEPDVVVSIGLHEIVTSSPLDISSMPTGLLVTLSHGEVLDLLAYVASNGDEDHPAFRR